MLKIKLKSSTLIETVVGLTILLIFIFMGMMILANLNKGNNANLKTRAHIVSDYFLQYTLAEKRYFDESFNDAGMRVDKLIEKLNDYAIVIKIEVYNADTMLILEKKQIQKIKLDEMPQ